MKVKRQKRVAKILKYFHLNFGFRRPFNLVVDGTFCAGCLEAKVNIKEQMPKYIGECKLVTTGCCITEIESLGSPQLYGATLILKSMALFRCDHKESIGASACIKSLVKNGNPHHFIVSSQDQSLREDLRNIPGIPLLYLHGNAPTLEKPSDLTESLTEKISDGKTNLSEHQHKILQELKKQKFGEEEKPIRKKRKGPRGPNPLSCKKSSKSKQSDSEPSNPSSGKKKRHTMCNGFTCSKNTLVGLNIFYILVSFLLIGVAVHGKVSGIVTSLPIIGGITACGIFLLIVSIIGLIGAMRHHQVTLFVYMIVLFCIFIIQFSVSCAALGVNDKDEEVILNMGWKTATNETKLDAEKLFDCCGLTNSTNPVDAYKCEELDCFKSKGSVDGCSPCMVKLQEKINSAFNAAGGLGLFFSFTELIGLVCTHKYRLLIRDLGEFA